MASSENASKNGVELAEDTMNVIDSSVCESTSTKKKDEPREAEKKSDDHRERHSHWTPEEWKTLTSYETLDYVICESDIYREYMKNQSAEQIRNKRLLRWFLLAVSGFLVGFFTFCASILTKKLIKLRYNVTINLLEDDNIAGGYFYFVGLALLYMSIATCLVNYVQPAAISSGIPPLKSYLNGVNVPDILKLDTLFVKLVGVIFAIASGVTTGKEGPIVCIGAMVASRVSHMPKIPDFFGIQRLKQFRNDFDRRNFVSAGAAAGIAAAFGAPIGGVLFSLEEASSFWSVPLTWGVFFTAMISTFTVNILISAHKGDIDDINDPGLITFGSFISRPYHLYELPIFCFMAVFGGLCGALFNYLNIQITHARKTFFANAIDDGQRKLYKCADALLIAFVTATVFYWVPYAMRDSCKAEVDVYDDCGNDLEQTYEQYLCKDGNYSSMATLMLQPQEHVIEALFHDYTSAGQFAFRIGDLFLFFFLYFGIAVWTFGTSIPGGLFVPLIMTGSTFGRIIGELVQDWSDEDDIRPGTYALIGATAMLGGATRMTISLTVILLETTNNIKYLLPIMLVLMIAKFCGDYFNISIYDMYVEVEAFPFVESQPPPKMVNLQAKDVMHSPAICLRVRPTVSQVRKVLSETTHNGFPVISNGTFVGMILRNQLIVLLNRGCVLDSTGNLRNEPSIFDFSQTLHSKSIALKGDNGEKDSNAVMDLTRFMNRSPLSVQADAPLTRVFQLYRSMGIRHMPVCDTGSRVIGMITRQELYTDFSSDLS
eukprot:g2635.t1